MVGKLTFQTGPTQTEATLEDNLQWVSTDKLVTWYLNTHFQPNRSPVVGDAGMALLHRAARKLNGQVTPMRQPIEGEADRVY